jgi:hypothetical protein
MLPGMGTIYKPMPDWIVMNVIQMVSQIGFIPDCVLPKSTLPQARFTVLLP